MRCICSSVLLSCTQCPLHLFPDPVHSGRIREELRNAVAAAAKGDFDGIDRTVLSGDEFHIQFCIRNMQLMSSQCNDFCDSAANGSIHAAGPDLPAGNKRMLRFPDAVHEAQTSDFALSQDDVATDQMRIAVGNVLLCQNISAIRIGDCLLIGRQELRSVRFLQNRDALAAAGIRRFNQDRIAQHPMRDAQCTLHTF